MNVFTIFGGDFLLSTEPKNNIFMIRYELEKKKKSRSTKIERIVKFTANLDTLNTSNIDKMPNKSLRHTLYYFTV